VQTIQEWLEAHQPYNAKQIFISDDDIKEKLIGNKIIIKDYKELKKLYINIKQIKTLIIENSEELEALETNIGKIKLIGNYSQLKEIKTNSEQQKPVIIEKKEPILCWKCISIVIFFITAFTVFYLHIKRKFREMKEYHDKNCRKKIKYD